jgi:hypothetical protein
MVYLNTDIPILRVHREYAQQDSGSGEGRRRCRSSWPYAVALSFAMILIALTTTAAMIPARKPKINPSLTPLLYDSIAARLTNAGANMVRPPVHILCLALSETRARMCRLPGLDFLPSEGTFPRIRGDLSVSRQNMGLP